MFKPIAISTLTTAATAGFIYVLPHTTPITLLISSAGLLGLFNLSVYSWHRFIADVKAKLCSGELQYYYRCQKCNGRMKKKDRKKNNLCEFCRPPEVAVNPKESYSTINKDGLFSVESGKFDFNIPGKEGQKVFCDDQTFIWHMGKWCQVLTPNISTEMKWNRTCDRCGNPISMKEQVEGANCLDCKLQFDDLIVSLQKKINQQTKEYYQNLIDKNNKNFWKDC